MSSVTDLQALAIDFDSMGWNDGVHFSAIRLSHIPTILQESMGMMLLITLVRWEKAWMMDLVELSLEVLQGYRGMPLSTVDHLDLWDSNLLASLSQVWPATYF